ALIEGILMRGPKKQAIVVRNPEGGLETKIEDLTLIRDHYPILGVPFIRGCVNFMDSMVKGVKALMWSAEFYPEEEDAKEQEPSKLEQWLERTFGSEKAMKFVVALAVAMGIVFSVALFIFLPTLLTGGMLYFFSEAPMWLRNLLEGIVKVVIFLAYLYLCSKMKDIRRTFSYHGAEHKTIFCYEQGLPLTIEHVREMPRFHPRCGTSFLFVVIIVSILASSVIFALPFVEELATNVFVRIGVHLILLPLVVSITYEINRLVGRFDNWITKALTAPGLWLQNFTTFEPDDSMIEVAIEALKLVLPDKRGEDIW
ncbi:MAG: hypothetical protein K0S60_467, partial [Evtepia sp.]|nr:hypothetical protein [Evtepia sp.]